jgi:hypothetical protein
MGKPMKAITASRLPAPADQKAHGNSNAEHNERRNSPDRTKLRISSPQHDDPDGIDPQPTAATLAAAPA